MATKRLTDADVKNATPKKGARIELWDSLAPGLCLRVSQSRKAWLVRYRAAGKQRRLVFGEYPTIDLADARIRAAEILRDVRRTEADPAAEAKRKKAEARAQPIKTFRDLAEAYVTACGRGQWMPRGKRQGERTMKDLRESLDRYVLPELGDLPLAEVTRMRVRQFQRDLTAGALTDGKEIGAQANKAISAIRRIYSWAVVEFEGKLVPVNVAASQPKVQEKPRERVLSDQELKALWAALRSPAALRVPPSEGEKEDRPLYLSRPMAITLQLSALLLSRPKEIAGMMVSELNLDQATWLVAAERMKARKAHLVPLPPRAVVLIREAIGLAQGALPSLKEGERSPADFPVFGSPRDRLKPVRSSSMTHTIRDVFRAIGIKDAILYDLRRTGSTALTSERIGVSPFIRSLVLSHTTDPGGGAAVSARHYDANQYVSEKRAALSAWEDLLLEVVGERPRSSNVRHFRGQ